MLHRPADHHDGERRQPDGALLLLRLPLHRAAERDGVHLLPALRDAALREHLLQHLQGEARRPKQTGVTPCLPRRPVHPPATSRSRGVMSRHESDKAEFPFVWVGIPYETRRGKNSRRLVFVIVSYISLFCNPAGKQTTQLYIVLHAQQDSAVHELVTGLRQQCYLVCKSI